MLQERWPLWNADLYDLEMISLQECNFQMDGLVYDIVRNPVQGQQVGFAPR